MDEGSRGAVAILGPTELEIRQLFQMDEALSLEWYQNATKDIIEDCIEDGFHDFWLALRGGTDVWLAHYLLGSRSREEDNDRKIHCLLPGPDSAHVLPPEALSVWEQADERAFLAQTPSIACVCDVELIKRSTQAIYFGNTAEMAEGIQYAEKHGIAVRQYDPQEIMRSCLKEWSEFDGFLDSVQQWQDMHPEKDIFKP